MKHFLSFIQKLFISIMLIVLTAVFFLGTIGYDFTESLIDFVTLCVAFSMTGIIVTIAYEKYILDPNGKDY